jgi:hypothetical protein
MDIEKFFKGSNKVVLTLLICLNFFNILGGPFFNIFYIAELIIKIRRYNLKLDYARYLKAKGIRFIITLFSIQVVLWVLITHSIYYYVILAIGALVSLLNMLIIDNQNYPMNYVEFAQKLEEFEGDGTSSLTSEEEIIKY